MRSVGQMQRRNLCWLSQAAPTVQITKENASTFCWLVSDMIRKFMSYILPPPSSTSFSLSSICTLAFLSKEVQNCRSSLIHGTSVLPIGNVLKYFHVLNFTKSSFILVLNFAFQANGNLHFRALAGNRASTTFRQLLLLLNYKYINFERGVYVYIYTRWAP